MNGELGKPPQSAHLDSLKGQIRAALITKRRGEARQLLGQLIALTNGEEGHENLKALLDAVSAEVKGYISTSGSVRERLVAGIPRPSIQAELDAAMPHWRAYAIDFPELQIAKEGLPHHEDPVLKSRVIELEKKIAKGLMTEALLEWDELGRPDSAAKGILVQILDGLSTLMEGIESKHWGQASSSHSDLEGLCDNEDAGSLQPGLRNFLAQVKNKLRWEGALNRVAVAGHSGDKGRRILLEELFKAKDEILRLSSRDKALGELQERIEAAIEELSRAGTEEPMRGGLPIMMMIGSLLLIVIIILVWLFINYWGSPSPQPESLIRPGIGDSSPTGDSVLALQEGAIWNETDPTSDT